MISLPSGTHIWIAAGVTDLRRGFTGLSAVAQTVLEKEPYSGHVFVFRGRRGDLIKLLWWDGDGLCLFAKRLERGRFIWPQAEEGTVSLSRAQLSMLLEGIDWRRPIRTSVPAVAERVIQLVTDPARARAMGEKGLAWVQQEWRWDLVAGRLEQILGG